MNFKLENLRYDENKNVISYNEKDFAFITQKGVMICNFNENDSMCIIQYLISTGDLDVSVLSDNITRAELSMNTSEDDFFNHTLLNDFSLSYDEFKEMKESLIRLSGFANVQ